MEKIYLFGHKSPDCDSTCAPKAYEWYLKQKGQEAEAILQEKMNNESKWVLEKFGVDKPRVMDAIPNGSKVIVFDTSDGQQLPENIDALEILEIWDHHNLGGLKTDKPVRIVADVVGCTCTLVWEQFQREGLDIDKGIAGLLLSAIASDILNGASPTTTDRDKKAMKELAKIAEVDLDQHVKEQFEAKSSLDGMGMEEIINFDAKDYDMSGKKVKICVVETVDPGQALGKRDEIGMALKQEKARKNYDYSFYFVVDIIKNYSTPIIVEESEREVLTKVYEQTITDDTKLEGVVSRKKQMVPVIKKVLSSW